MMPALLTRRSSRSWPARKRSLNERTELRSARSSAATSIFAAGRAALISLAVERPLASSRQARTRFAPRAASSLATMRPRPLLAPVTTAMRPLWSGISAGSHFVLIFFLSCLQRQHELSQEGIDVGDEADALPAASIRELGHDGWVHVDADGVHRCRQEVAGGDRVQHRREHQRHPDVRQRGAHPLLCLDDVGDHVGQRPVVADAAAQNDLDAMVQRGLHHAARELPLSTIAWIEPAARTRLIARMWCSWPDSIGSPLSRLM